VVVGGTVVPPPAVLPPPVLLEPPFEEPIDFPELEPATPPGEPTFFGDEPEFWLCPVDGVEDFAVVGDVVMAMLVFVPFVFLIELRLDFSALEEGVAVPDFVARKMPPTNKATTTTTTGITIFFLYRSLTCNPWVLPPSLRSLSQRTMGRPLGRPVDLRRHQ
jgi:hypothetical protein